MLTRESAGTGRILICPAVFFMAFTLICFQLCLVRAFAYTRFYHFYYLIISIALAGFGISGTFLSLLKDRIEKHSEQWLLWLHILFTVSLPICYMSAQSLPLNIQYLVYSGQQLLLLLLYIFLIFIPFFLGASWLGLCLVRFSSRAKRIYGANLWGSGAGGIGALFITHFFSPELAPLKTVFFPLLGLFFWIAAFPDCFSGRGRIKAAGGIIFCLSVVLIVFFINPPVPVDPNKTIEYFSHLAAQGDAECILTSFDARSRIDVYSSSSLHQTLFAGLSTPVQPPPQWAVLVDGDPAGVIFRIDDKEAALILDYTPQAIVYRLLHQPRVLLLDDKGGTGCWLAARNAAQSITNVTGDNKIAALLNGKTAVGGIGLSRLPTFRCLTAEPRLYLEQAQDKYDLIQISRDEVFTAAAGGGISALHENNLLTVEAVAGCFALLNDGGLLVVTRGVQSPPRDNIRIFATFAAALTRSGIGEPGQHLYQARNYLAVTTVLSKKPFNREQLEKLNRVCSELIMDTEYYPGIISADIRQVNQISGPPGKKYSYYHQAALDILSGREKNFFANYVYSVKPAIDNSPYFSNFFRWKSLGKYITAFGNNWFRKLELGYVILVITLCGIIFFAFLGIFFPLLFIKKGNRSPGIRYLLFFFLIGMGFIFLELVFIQKTTTILGNPLFSMAAITSSLLFFAGTGSITQSSLKFSPAGRIRGAALLVTVLALLFLSVLNPVLKMLINFPLAARLGAVILLFVPVSFFMGFFFSSGIECLEQSSPESIPLAWGVNGFASVIASPLAMILFMDMGFSQVLVFGGLLYLGCGFVFKLRRPRGRRFQSISAS